MRARGWMAVAAVLALGLGACRRERHLPETPPAPRDISDMDRAGFPANQGLPTGRTGEGPGFPGEDSAVKQLPVRKPINVGSPGEKSSEQAAPAPRR